MWHVVNNIQTVQRDVNTQCVCVCVCVCNLCERVMCMYACVHGVFVCVCVCARKRGWEKSVRDLILKKGCFKPARLLCCKYIWWTDS